MNDNTNKSTHIQIRIAPEDKQAIAKRAKALRLSVSSYLLMLAIQDIVKHKD